MRNRKRNNKILCVLCQCSMSEMFGSKTICPRKIRLWSFGLLILVGVRGFVVGVCRFWLGTCFVDEESRI